MALDIQPHEVWAVEQYTVLKWSLKTKRMTAYPWKGKINNNAIQVKIITTPFQQGPKALWLTTSVLKTTSKF